MTADLDLSPEAVERLTRELDNWATIAEADRDMEMQDAKHTGERPDMQPVLVEVDLRECRAAAATLRALSAENARLKRIEHGLRNEAKDYHDEMHKGFDEIARLRAERDAAWQAGAEAMRERAAYEVAESGAIVDHPSVFMGGPSRNAIRIAGAFADRIRALPIPSKEVET